MSIKHVLIVENEKLLQSVFINAFNALNQTSHSFRLTFKLSYGAALKFIETQPLIDIAIINMNIPPYRGKTLLLGEHINDRLKSTFPNTKIVLFLTGSNNIHINSLLKGVDPDCLLIKSDVDYEELLLALKTAINKPPYYSNSVLQFIRKRLANTIEVDKTDKSILYYLSLGMRVKDISKYLFLSCSTIDSRKRKLKDIFGLGKASDIDLLDKAREYGLI